MLLEITFDKPGPRSFAEYASVLATACKCKVLPQKRYLTFPQILYLLPMDPHVVIEFLTDSKHVHGFVYEGEVYVHPHKFAHRYLRLLVEGIKDIEMSKEMVH